VKQHEVCQILYNKQIADGIFDMRIKTDLKAVPGQFINLHTGLESLILPRPVSICEIIDGGLRLIYRVEGKGTKHFAKLYENTNIRITGALGNGFTLNEFAKKKKVAVIGGGIGIPPLLELAKQVKETNPATEVHAFLGFRAKEHIIENLIDDFAKYCKIHISTDDGSFDYHGNAVDDFKETMEKADIAAACGPLLMLKAIAGHGEAVGMKVYVSVEERMACGVGACLGCAIKMKVFNGDYIYKKVCSDGPVFDSAEVVWE